MYEVNPKLERYLFTCYLIIQNNSMEKKQASSKQLTNLAISIMLLVQEGFRGWVMTAGVGSLVWTENYIVISGVGQVRHEHEVSRSRHSL